MKDSKNANIKDDLIEYKKQSVEIKKNYDNFRVNIQKDIEKKYNSKIYETESKLNLVKMKFIEAKNDYEEYKRNGDVMNERITKKIIKQFRKKSKNLSKQLNSLNQLKNKDLKTRLKDLSWFETKELNPINKMIDAIEYIEEYDRFKNSKIKKKQDTIKTNFRCIIYIIIIFISIFILSFILSKDFKFAISILFVLISLFVLIVFCILVWLYTPKYRFDLF